MYRSFTEELFNQPIEKITQQDLDRYFQHERDETMFLEFKSFTDKAEDKRSKAVKEVDRIKGVLKTINAFLNSSGGLLIWGAPESVEVQRGERKVKMCQGALMPVLEFYDRDAFINKLASQISPLPQGVRIHSVPVDEGYTYLFEVPESQNKPHQFDGRYYVRMDTRTDIAPHYLVYALCRQVKFPELSLKINFNRALARITKDTIDFEADVEIANQTEFVNEHDIYLVVSTPDGRVGLNRFLDGDRTLQLDGIASILPFGLPVKRQLCVFVDKPIYDDAGIVLNIWFGGRVSPVKRLTYKLYFINQRIQVVDQSVLYDVQAELIE